MQVKNEKVMEVSREANRVVGGGQKYTVLMNMTFVSFLLYRIDMYAHYYYTVHYLE